MTSIGKTAAAMAVIGSCCLASTAQAATQPVAGIYVATATVTAATPSGGGTCTQKVGDVIVVEYAYSGPGLAGTKARLGLPGDTEEFVVSYPTAPAAGVTTWSGTETLAEKPGTFTFSGAFSTTFTFVDGSSWLQVSTQDGPSGNGTGKCTTTTDSVLIRSGK